MATKNGKKYGTKIAGILYELFIVWFALTTLPVYLFRVVVIHLAQAFRSQLGDILSGKSAIFVSDYFAETPPRSNAVVAMVFEGSLTLEDVNTLVAKNWIGAEGYENLQRYPVKWLGFAFWKKIFKPFQADDYVHKHSGMETQVTDNMLSEIIETLLNKKFAKGQSPWELHFIENYKISGKETKAFGKAHSVLILTWHHCLMDAAGMFTALVEGLFKQRWVRQRESQPPPRTITQNILHVLAFPINVLLEMADFVSHTFESNAFKIANDRKEWHQVYATSGKISNKLIRDIKNAFGVSYTSVLLSTISAAVHKTQLQTTGSVPIGVILPEKLFTKRKILANHLTCTQLHLPMNLYTSPIERLVEIDKLFEERRNSVQPIAVQLSSIFAGAHFPSVADFFTKNRMMPIGLTNFAGPQGNVEVNENTKWIYSSTIVGGYSGDAGICIATLSHGQSMEISVAVERALMTKEQAQEFINHIKEELDALDDLIPKVNKQLPRKINF